jgi:hypothetical protein
MVVARIGRRPGNKWLVWAFWAAGAALLLVELNAGMNYFETGLQQNMGNLLGWAPAMGMMTLKFAEQSLWHWSTLALVFSAVPVAALGLLLVAVGLAVNKHTRSARGEDVKS